MGFRIASNVASLVAHTNATAINKQLDSSLEKLSSGYKINKAADDASGLAIADSLRVQSNSLGQAIRNANDAIGIIQIADKAMDEQVKILDTIKVKAVQAAQDGQNTNSRIALQSDITRLLEELDNIASTTTFNGKSLLAGGFSNANFQIGAYSNQVIKASIAATSSDKIGQTRFETGQNISESQDVKLTFKAVNGIDDITLESVSISHTVGTGLGALVEVINKNANELQVRASWSVQSTGNATVGHSIAKDTATNIVTNNRVDGFKINDVVLGTINDILPNDSDGKVAAAINKLTAQTGVRAIIDARGHLALQSIDGRGIRVEAEKGLDVLGLELNSDNNTKHANYGRLSLVRNDARDILVVDYDKDGKQNTEALSIGYGKTTGKEAAETIINLRSIRGSFNINQASAMGAHSSKNSLLYNQTSISKALPTGVTTYKGAQTVMDIADTAIKDLNIIRADLGSVQIQLEATVNNISVTKANIKFSESQIRDTDFASETSQFKKNTILAQAGSYAISQTSAIDQNVTRLLQ